ncbi:hypothetical protein ACHMXB_19555 [Arthrobacter sp. UC242_113]|uniref:hypothetical protein n=1 Tax=Arthrobacter sp. UC242_113 TaxID=3374550 RepID=UPI0037565806
MGNTPARPGRRNVALIGANFGLALHPVDRKGIHIPGEPASCFASFWVADWSRWGTGTVLMVATLQGWRSYGSNEFFASSLATELTRFFPEAARFPLAGVSHTQDEFDVELDLERGFRATGRRAALEISGVLDRRRFSAPDFQLGPASASMSNIYHPCSTGKLAEFGVEWPGAPTVYPGPRGPSSSAYMAVAESWAM